MAWQVEYLSEGDTVNGLSNFDVKNAHCFSPDDERRLRCATYCNLLVLNLMDIANHGGFCIEGHFHELLSYEDWIC